MKAEELMIGDWVDFYHPYEPEKKIVTRHRVTEIFECGLVGISNHPNPVHADHIEPIPLVPEILEKNGFLKIQIHGEKQDDIFQCFDGEIIIEVGIYDPNFILIHYRYETPDGINSGELSSIVKVDGGKFYLHELQHALRLCGITREIIL